MAPIKFEEKFREKLEERTITPSEMTWDKLDSKLDKLEKKNKKSFWWLGLAASFIGVLIISNLFFKSSTTTINKPVIVDSKSEVEIKEDLIKLTEKKVEIIVNNENGINEEKETEEKATINKPSIVSKQGQQIIATAVKKETILNTNRVKETNTSVIDENFQRNTKTTTAIASEKPIVDNFEAQKINEVVAQIQELKASKKFVTDAEIDSLLNTAQRDIYINRTKVNSTSIVDANSLLFEVENELEQSFRERVFETIKSGYKTVRTAVVERKNN